MVTMGSNRVLLVLLQCENQRKEYDRYYLSTPHPDSLMLVTTKKSAIQPCLPPQISYSPARRSARICMSIS